MPDDIRTLDDVRGRLQGRRGAAFWRSLEELAESERFRELLHREFPPGACELTDPISRRRFLSVIGASLALAGVTGCTPEPPQGAVLPYVSAPEQIVPGRPLFYATAMTLNGYGVGLLVESHLGRPTKVEGNPQHPASLGATDAFAQASVLQLYDPDRSPVTLQHGEIQPWTRFVAEAQSLRRRFIANGGRGLHILTEALTSPTLIAQIDRLRSEMPNAQWHRYEMGLSDSANEGSDIAFGQRVHSFYRLDRADVLVTLDADIFAGEPHCVRYAHDFAERRRVRGGAAQMSRLYAIGGAPTLTGALADHRLPLRVHEVDAFARVLATTLEVPGILPRGTVSPDASGLARVLADDLIAHRGRSLVVAGEHQPPAVHAVAHAINSRLGNAGETIVYTEPIELTQPSELRSLLALTAAMSAGEVELLLMLGGNPAYTAPADLQFATQLRRVPTSVHLSSYVDETSALCTWHVPAAHFLESWSDVRAFDGTASIVQPLIRPLYDGRSAHEVLAAFSSDPLRSGHDLVKDSWRAATHPGAADNAVFERDWRTWLHEGVVSQTAATPVTPALLRDVGSRLPEPIATTSDLEVIFRPDPSVYDGRFANNAWLQELPKPLTKLTWDNAVLIAPDTAQRLGVASEDLVSVEYRGRSVVGPVLVVPGQAQDSIALHLGYGRVAGGSLAATAGFDANRIRTADAPWMGSGARVRPTGEQYPLATTQLHFMMEGRDFVRAGTFAEFLHDPDYAHDRHPHLLGEHSLYPEWNYSGPQWGMSIDNTICVGCNACVLACQAENNVPSVGKDGVLVQREMHWLRIDHYYQGPPRNPRSYFQPMLCQHCEKAPCEVVCPVAATVHSADGLNQMIYNRCVGTRYCSNNCPYKVRRFNFLDYRRGTDSPTLRLLANPDVTVRTLGVMEKCTYCVQRINAAKIAAETEGRALADGDIATACEAACPTRAIVFGDIADESSRVAALKREPHDYHLLAELNVQPRTSYLAALRNPNPALGHRHGGLSDQESE
jgi:molybdopterin-containing oxidoreductase family iron-sulfur binding subunit